MNPIGKPIDVHVCDETPEITELDFDWKTHVSSVTVSTEGVTRLERLRTRRWLRKYAAKLRQQEIDMAATFRSLLSESIYGDDSPTLELGLSGLERKGINESIKG